ncbi:hypothetical protein ALC57_14341 [Trachymyrmex cornetzi]|uniref:Uncharacterized protein n=1 Tax=Trachymyrmex cornetzi TaxID=471704 RepID=A0A195DKA8_9HYME|nr:hypothetical protein ALC57_14341 [Trachymyrmex cornetzi]
MTRDHCPDLDKLARRLQHRCQRHLLPNGSSANATDNVEKKILANSYALLERNYLANLVAFVMYTHKIAALTIRSLHTIQCRPKQSTKQSYFRFEAKVHMEYSKFMRQGCARKEKRRKGSIVRITPYSLSTLPAAIRRHARSVGYVCTTAAFIAVRTRVYAHIRACTHSHVYVASRVGTAPPRIPDVTTLAHLARRTLEMSPLSPPSPLFRVSRSAGAARSEYALPPLSPPSLSPSATHRRRPVIYSRSSGDGQSRRSRHARVASPRAVPSTRAARGGMARHGVRFRGTVPRGFSRVSTTILAAVLRTYASPLRFACARARTRTPLSPLSFCFFSLQRLTFISR